jgi:hypothetical protein
MHSLEGKTVIRTAAALVSLLLAAFFGFVGFHKSVSPISELVKHKAWTVHLWEPLGRFIGVTELLCAGALALSVIWEPGFRWRSLAAAYLVINQIAAAATHLVHAETDALPQNLILVLLAIFVGWASTKNGD